MSRARVGYPFRPQPLELSRDWDRATFYQRALGAEMNRAFGTDLVARGADWREHVCRKLAIGRGERMAAKRALDAMLELGLVVMDDDNFRVLYAPLPLVAVPSNDHQPSTNRQPSADQPQIISEPTAENHSVRVSQSRSEESRSEEKREDAPAGAAPPEPQQLELEPTPAPKPRRKADPELVLLKRVVEHERKELGIAAFGLPGHVSSLVLRKARELGGELEDGLHRIAREALARALETGKEPHWALKDWQPYQGTVAAMRGRRSTHTPHRCKTEPRNPDEPKRPEWYRIMGQPVPPEAYTFHGETPPAEGEPAAAAEEAGAAWAL